MTLRLSSPLRDAVVSNYGLGAMMTGGHIQVYSGTQPDTADMPPTGTLLAFITQDGLPIALPGESDDSGLMMQLGTNAGELTNAGSWVLVGKASGEPGWWRFVGEPVDTGAAATTECRIDGAVTDSFSPPLGPISPSTVFALSEFLISLPYQ